MPANSQTHVEGESTDVAIAGAQAHQESDAVVWTQMATKWVQLDGPALAIPADPPSANMKVITSIYLNCRPDLRDEWLAGSDQDTELEDALVRPVLCRDTRD